VSTAAPVEVFIIRIVTINYRAINVQESGRLGRGLIWMMGFALVSLMLLGLSCAAPGDLKKTESPKFSAIVVSQDLAVGGNRVTFGLVDLDGMPVRTDHASVSAVYYAPGDSQGKVVDSGTADFVAWPPPGNRGVFVVDLRFDASGEGTESDPGLWELQVTTTTQDKIQVDAKAAIRVAKEPSTPALGSSAPPSVTLTEANVDNITMITSASDPDKDFYQLSIHQALQEDKPLVVVFATPAFCVSATCGPQLEILTRLKEKYQDRVNFIHVEAFENPHLMEGGRPAGDLVAAVKDWGLPSEPWTFIVGSDGVVKAKYDQFVPEQELEKVLNQIS